MRTNPTSFTVLTGVISFLLGAILATEMKPIPDVDPIVTEDSSGWNCLTMGNGLCETPDSSTYMDALRAACDAWFLRNTALVPADEDTVFVYQACLKGKP